MIGTSNKDLTRGTPLSIHSQVKCEKESDKSKITSQNDRYFSEISITIKSLYYFYHLLWSQEMLSFKLICYLNFDCTFFKNL